MLATRITCLLFVGAVLVSICAAQAPVMGPSKFYRGHYRHGFKVYEFTPCGAKKPWSVSIEGDVASLVKAVTSSGGLIGGLAYVELHGRLSPPGHWGHLNQYRHEITVDRVLRASRKSPLDCQ